LTQTKGRGSYFLFSLPRGPSFVWQQTEVRGSANTKPKYNFGELKEAKMPKRAIARRPAMFSMAKSKELGCASNSF